MQRGLSLIELMIVIGICGILAAGVFINLPASLAKFEVQGAAEVLAADIRWLQQVSINSVSTEGKVVLIPILVMRQTQPYGYRIIGEKSAVIRSYDFPATVIGGGNQYELSFKTTGRPAEGSQLTFTLKSTRVSNVSAKVIVEMITGRVRIE